VSNVPGKPVSFSRPKVGYFSNRPRTLMMHGQTQIKTLPDLIVFNDRQVNDNWLPIGAALTLTEKDPYLRKSDVILKP